MTARGLDEARKRLAEAVQEYLDSASFPQADVIHRIYTDHQWAWARKPDPGVRCNRHWWTWLPCGLCYTPPAGDVTPDDRRAEAGPVVLPPGRLGERLSKYVR